MKVRTIRDHDNPHGDTYHKSGSAGPIYDVTDEAEARRLIDAGYVEAADAKERGRRGAGGNAGEPSGVAAADRTDDTEEVADEGGAAGGGDRSKPRTKGNRRPR